MDKNHEKASAVSNGVYVPLAILFSLLWASAFIAVKSGLASSTPFFLMGSRFMMAGVALLAFAVFVQRASLPGSGREWAKLTVIGLLNNAAYLGIAAISLQSISGGMGAVLASTSPLMLAVAATFVLKEKLGFGKVFGLALAFSSVAAIMASRTEAGESPGAMALLFFANAFLVAGTILFKRWSPEGSITVVNGVQLLAAGLVLLPLALLVEPLGSIVWDANLFLSIGYLTFAVSCGAMAVWFFLLRNGDASRAGSFFFLNPIFGLILGAVLLGESFYATDIIGIIGVAAGIYLVQRGE